jgi:folate-binding protein YgfZ
MTTADRAAREGALVVVRRDWGTLEVTGPERLSWLQGLVTCDVGDLPRGEGRWGLVLTKPGKIRADVVILAAGGKVLIALPSVLEVAIAEGLSSFLVMEDAELEVGSSRWTWAAIHGPRAVEVAERLASELGGQAASVDVTGLGGAVVAVPAARSPQLEAAIVALAGVVGATIEDWERLSVERLVPLFGLDMGPELNPHEAALDRRCVSWTKGCYLGQEAVCMQDMRGRVKRRLTLLRLEGEMPPERGAVVTDAQGTVVGKVTRGVRTETMGGVAALALIAAEHSDPGATLRVQGVQATVVEPMR